jgi:hypothetical protein
MPLEHCEIDPWALMAARSALWSTLCTKSHALPWEQYKTICKQSCPSELHLSTPIAVRKVVRRARDGLLDVRLMLFFGFGGSMGVNLGTMFSGSLSSVRSVCIQGYTPTVVPTLAFNAPLLHTIRFAGFGPHDFALCIGQGYST